MLGSSDLADLVILEIPVLEKDAFETCGQPQENNHDTNLWGFLARKAISSSMDNCTSFFHFINSELLL